MVRCITTGKGVKGAIIVCESPIGDVGFRCLKIAPYKYSVYSEYPPSRFKTVMYTSGVSDLRAKIQSWLEYELSNLEGSSND